MLVAEHGKSSAVVAREATLQIRVNHDLGGNDGFGGVTLNYMSMTSIIYSYYVKIPIEIRFDLLCQTLKTWTQGWELSLPRPQLTAWDSSSSISTRMPIGPVCRSLMIDLGEIENPQVFVIVSYPYFFTYHIWMSVQGNCLRWSVCEEELWIKVTSGRP